MIAGVGLVPVVAGLATVLALGSWARRAGPVPAARWSARGLAPEPEVPAWFRRALGLVELPVDPVAGWAAALVVGVVAGGWLALRSPALAGAVLVLAGAGRAVRRAGAGRRRDAGPSDAELVAVVVAVQAALAAGSSLDHAVARVGAQPGAAGRDLAGVAAAAAAGTSLHRALDRWAHRRPGTGVPLVVDALAIAATTGADRGRALAAVADTLRDRQARAREVQALAAQARLSAVVLVVLPVAFAVLVAAWDPAVARFATGTPAGWACLAGGVALDAVGACWMARLIGAVR